jgi:hypothetical protein
VLGHDFESHLPARCAMSAAVRLPTPLSPSLLAVFSITNLMPTPIPHLQLEHTVPCDCLQAREVDGEDSGGVARADGLNLGGYKPPARRKAPPRLSVTIGRPRRSMETAQTQVAVLQL